MTSLQVALCICIIYFSGVRSEYRHLHWNDCGSDPAVHIHDLGVSPMPLLVPGNMSFTLHMTGSLPQMDRMILSLSSKRKTSWWDIPLPCLLNVGSCTYDNTCTLLETMQRENWVGVMANIGGQIQAMLAHVGLNEYCGVPVQEINIQNYVLTMPSVPSVLVFLAEGDYETKLQAFDYATNRLLICVDMRMTMKLQRDTCNDWFCRMRRRISL